MPSTDPSVPRGTKLSDRCIGCREDRPAWRFTPRHRMASFNRPVTEAEVMGFANGARSLEDYEARVGVVSESGRYVTENRKRLQILIICGSCGRTWWTVQRGIVSRWFDHFEMTAPPALQDLY